MQNQHTRELISARNTSHKYNNENLSTCVTYFEQYFIVRVLCQPNHFQHIVTVRVSGVRADNTLTALIVSSCIAGLLILLAILGGVIFCVLRFVTLGPTLRASLSGTFLQTLPDLVTPLKGHSLSPRGSCPATRSAPSERFRY